MPDLDLVGLGEETRQVFKPRFEEVLRRARRRRRWLGALTATVVALAGGGVAVGLAGGTASPPPDRASYRGTATTLVVAGDIWHLYQLTETCDTGGCRAHFAVSADRGASWSLVPPPGPDGADRQVVSAANTTVVVATATNRWMTVDAGRTWFEATFESRATTQTDQLAYVDGSQVLVVRPGRGVLAPVAAAQPLKEARSFDGGGAMWMVGFEEDGGRGLSTAVSGDFGRSWQVQRLPRDDGFLDVTSANGVDLYALYGGDDAFEVFSSRDGGATWTRTATVRRGPGDGRLLATRSGILWLSTPGGVFLSTDAGRTFSVPGFTDLGGVAFDTSIDGAYVASTVGADPRTWVSEDGYEFEEVP